MQGPHSGAAGVPPVLRVGAQGLSAGEAGLLRALVTLIANGRSGFPWVYAERDADATVGREPSGCLVLRVRGEVRAQLAAPLTARGLEECLDRVAAGGEAPAPHAAAGAADAAREGTGARAGRYRLRRWPPPELLRADKQRVRMATFLSRQWFTVEELASVSQTPLERCQVFMQMLQGFDLVSAAPAALHARPSMPSAGAMPARWNLVRSIRRKLGLREDA
jgi:hypothetical protein